jgi:PKHD-type hydroxylase
LEENIMKKSKKEIQEVSHDWWLEVGNTESWAFMHNVFTAEETTEIHKLAKKYNLFNGKVGDGNNMRIDDGVRDSEICFFNSADTDARWIFQRLAGTIKEINQQFWNFDLTRIETLQYSEYNVGQFYKDHIDMMYEGPNQAIRKLSFTVQLTDPDEYEGGDMLFKTSLEPQVGKRNQGTALFFPSYVLHEVKPVTKGTRHALVGWVTGPAFK